MIFARKMPEFYIIIAQKIFFPNFRGHVPLLVPLSYAYVTEEDKAFKILFLIIGYGLWKLMREFPDKGRKRSGNWIGQPYHKAA